ncbi:PST family polysaccharide transporter [Labrenzia sp. EL_159]|nr:PST family polysaccharide transporter [Labrenzia sp. EL_162]MBG6197508.1 PST family polysaccharide transporter [Labrenzia sp. EL_159]
MKNLKLLSGVVLIGGSQTIRVIVNLLTIAVLARFVSSEEFGLIAVLTSITLIANYFGEFGLSVSIIRHQGKGLQRVCNLVFWWTVILSSTIGSALFFASDTIAALLKNDEFAQLISAAALLYVIVASRSAHKAFVERAMRFKLIAIIEVVGALVSSCIAIVLAIMGAGVWALLAQQYALAGFLALGYMAFSGFRPGLPRRLFDARSLIKFGSQLTLYQLLSIAGNYADRPIIARLQGVENLGYYSVGNQLIQFLVLHISSAVQRVMLPALSSIREDMEMMRQSYLKVMHAICLVTLPSMVGLSLVSDEFVLIFLGDNWAPTGQIIAWNALAGPFLALNWFNYTVILTLGRVGLQLILGSVQAALTVLAFSVGAYFGIDMVVKLFLLATLVITVPIWVVTARSLKLSIFQTLKQLSVLFMNVGIMALVVSLVDPLVTGSTMFRLVCLSTLGGIVFVSMEMVFERKKLLGFLKRKQKLRA